jgi:type IV pilus assembly protein PilC
VLQRCAPENGLEELFIYLFLHQISVQNTIQYYYTFAQVYKQKINAIAKDVSQGITISESIQDSPYFSNLTVSMMNVGEKTAQVDDLAKKIAEYYELKAATMADNFSKLIQPFIILIVGTLVGAVILAIMLPMTELLSGIDNL